MTAPVTFSVIAKPEPKGSAKPVPLLRKFPATIRSFGELLRSIAITSDNAQVKKYQRAIAAGARCVLAGAQPSADPIALTLRFYLPPPLKIPASRGGWPIARGSGDVDKIIRANLDALSGIAYVDDIQVVHVTATKFYAATPAQARTEITITPIAIGLPFPETELTHERGDRRHHTRTPATAGVPW